MLQEAEEMGDPSTIVQRRVIDYLPAKVPSKLDDRKVDAAADGHS